MSRTYDVMAAGHVCIDVIPQFPDTGAKQLSEIMQPGKLVQMGPVSMSTGGPVSNTGIGLKRLGNSVVFCARIGDDEFGRLTLDILRGSGNADGIHVVPGSTSSYTIVVAPPGIDRVFLHNPGANNDFSPEDLDPSLIARCRLFHFGYPPLMRRMYTDEGRELARIFRTAREAGAATSCDMALPDPASEAGKAPWGKILAHVLPHVDIFLPSIEEALYMLEPERFLQMKKEQGGAELIDHLDPEDYGRLSGKILALGARMTSLKSGHRGFYLRTGSRAVLESMGETRPGNVEAWADRELWAPAYDPPKIASATGSGDSSIAGFLTAFLRGESPERALLTANCLGWQNVQVMDAVSGVRSWEETIALIADGLPVRDIHLASPAWNWDGESGLWKGPADQAV